MVDVGVNRMSATRSPRTLHTAIAALLLVVAALAGGCGRGILYPPTGGYGDAVAAPDTPSSMSDAVGAVDGRPDGPPDNLPDAGPPIDVAADRSSDRGSMDRPVDGASDAPADVRMDRPADLVVDVAQDVPADRPPDTTPDLTPDRGPPDTGPDCNYPYDPRHCGSCEHDCTKLPNVDPGSVYCNLGTCYAYGCRDGFMQCSRGPEQGCDVVPGSDPRNCGGCGIVCGQVPGSPGVCKDGTCVGECPAGWGDCTPQFGCETDLSTPDNCGACGRPACGLANVQASCFDGADSCASAICSIGFGNCATAVRDCEAAIGSTAGTCFPKYRGTLSFAITNTTPALALGPGGVLYIGGGFSGTIDFDPTSGVDERTDYGVPFLTRMEADGRYGWTRTLVTSGYAAFVSVTATADGGVLATGTYQGIIDLDPGAGTDYHSSVTGEPFVVKLSAAGDLVWGRTFAMTSTPTGYGQTTAYAQAVMSAPDGSVYVAGQFWSGQLDFDPGPGVVERSATDLPTTFVVKLTAAGDFVWVDVYDLSLTPNCTFNPVQFAMSPSGTVWGTGTFAGKCDLDPGPGIDLRQSRTSGYDVVVFQIGADGGAAGTWAFGGDNDDSVTSIALDGQGAAYIGGTLYGTADFDPGPGDATRNQPNGGTYVVKLSSAGAFQWVQTITGASIVSLAVTPDGGAIVLGSVPQTSLPVIVKVGPDPITGWTLAFGSYYGTTYPQSIVAGATGFVIGGFSYTDGDFDPGPGQDIVGSGMFVSRYDF